MADSTIGDLTPDSSPGLDSLIETEDDPSGTPASKSATLEKVSDLFIAQKELATLAALQAYTGNAEVVFVKGRTSSGDGYEGTFQYLTGDYSTEVAADTTHAIYVQKSGVATTTGCWVRNIENNVYMVDWFGTTAAAFNTLMDVIALRYPARSTQPDEALGYDYSGVTVVFKDNTYDWSGQTAPAEFIQGVTVIGAGMRASRITSDYDGAILRNRYTSGTDPYMWKGGGVQNITIEGDRTKSSQVCLDLMRPGIGTRHENIEVCASGGDGIRFRESITAEATNIYANDCVGDGIHTSEGEDTWGDGDNGQPTNNLTLINPFGRNNDGAGIHIEDSNSVVVYGGGFQGNYDAGGANTGYNVLIDGTARGHAFHGTWFEGGDGVEAHVYVNTTTTSGLAPDVSLIDCTYLANGVAGNVDRAIIVNKGVASVHNMITNLAYFKTFGSSEAPIRINTANSAKVNITGNMTYSTSANSRMVEDQNYADTGLKSYVREDVVNAGVLYSVGRTEQQVDAATDYLFRGYVVGDSTPQIGIYPNFIMFTDGSTANGPRLTYYAGTPEGNLPAYPGSICMNENSPLGSGEYAIYIKRTGTGNTGWEGVGTVIP